MSIVPMETAREVIRAARLSAYAQLCELPEEQRANYQTLMRREEAKAKWTDQQMLFINQLHLFTVMTLTGKVQLVEKDGDKQVVVQEGKPAKAATCSDTERKKVQEQIMAFVAANPAPAAAAAKPKPEPTRRQPEEVGSVGRNSPGLEPAAYCADAALSISAQYAIAIAPYADCAITRARTRGARRIAGDLSVGGSSRRQRRERSTIHVRHFTIDFRSDTGMTKRIRAKHKIDRRLGQNIWGRPKSPLNKRESRPGQHGERRQTKLSDYGQQLRAKQKLKGYYANISERQFNRIYKEARRFKGSTSEHLIGLLERRLDAIVYRAKFVPTMFAARQFVSHGHITVNGRRVNIPSFRCRVGDVVEVKEKGKQMTLLLEAIKSAERDVPDYIEADHNKMTAKLIARPGALATCRSRCTWSPTWWWSSTAANDYFGCVRLAKPRVALHYLSAWIRYPQPRRSKSCRTLFIVRLAARRSSSRRRPASGSASSRCRGSIRTVCPDCSRARSRCLPACSSQ